jgi:hypothetical protein
LQELEETAKTSSPSSWVRPDADSTWLEGRSDRCRYFDTHGFLVVPNFLETAQALKDQMEDLANNLVYVDSFLSAADTVTRSTILHIKENPESAVKLSS